MPFYSVTGLSKIPDRVDSYQIVSTALAKFDDALGIATGGAPGIDTLVIEILFEHLPHIERPVFAPLGKKHNQAVYQYATEVIYIDGGYLKRDDALAKYGISGLIAFPLTTKEVLRSGTWATIRRARKLGHNVYMFPLTEE